MSASSFASRFLPILIALGWPSFALAAEKVSAFRQAINDGSEAMREGDMVRAVQLWESGDSETRFTQGTPKDREDESELLSLRIKGLLDLREFTRAAAANKKLAQLLESHYPAAEEKILRAWSWYLCWFAMGEGDRQLAIVQIQILQAAERSKALNPDLSAVVHFALGCFAESASKTEEALREYGWAVTLGEHSAVPDGQLAAAEALARLGQHESSRSNGKMLDYCTRAWKLYGTIFGKNNLRTQQARVNMAIAMGILKMPEASSHLAEAVADLESVGAGKQRGLRRYVLGNAMCQECFYSRDRYPLHESYVRMKEALAHIDASGVRLLPPDAMAFAGAAKAALLMKENDLGLAYYTRAYEIRRDYMGTGHPEVLRTAEALKQLRSTLGQ